MGSFKIKLNQSTDEQDETLREYKAPGFWEDMDNGPWERRLVVAGGVVFGVVSFLSLILAAFGVR